MKIKKTKIENNYTVGYSHLNRHKTLFGGQLLYWLDEVMGLTIRKYTSVPFVTATIDTYQFIDSVNLFEVLKIKSYVSHVGTKSVEVFAEITAYNDTDKKERLVGLSTSTFSVKKDYILLEPLEKIENSDKTLERYVIESFEKRKSGELSPREFAKNYKCLYDKEII